MKKGQIFMALIAIYIIITLPVKAQKISWGDEGKMTRSIFDHYDLIGADSSGYYMVVREQTLSIKHPYKARLDYFDKNLKLLASNTIQIVNENDDKLHYEKCVLFGGKIYAFASEFDKATHSINLYQFEVNKTTGKPFGGPKMIAKYSVEDKYKAGNFINGTDKYSVKTQLPYGSETVSYNIQRFLWSFSPDSSKMSIISNFMSKSKTDNVSIGVKVYATGMKPVWDKEVQLPFNNRAYFLTDFTTDDDGDVFFGALAAGSEGGQYSISECMNKGSDIKQNRILLKGFGLGDFKLGVTNTGDVVATGFYTTPQTKEIAGTYYMRINPKEGKVLAEKKEALPESFLSDLTMVDNKFLKHVKIGLDMFDLQPLVLRADGGALLLADQYGVDNSYEKSGFTFGGGSSGKVTVSNYDLNILAISINPDGNLEWQVKVPKQQITKNDYSIYSSFTTIVNGDNVNLLFNDNLKGEVTNGNYSNAFKYRFDGKAPDVVMVTIGPNGKQTQKTLFNNADIDVLFRPKLCISINNNELLLYGENGKDYKLGKLTFN